MKRVKRAMPEPGKARRVVKAPVTRTTVDPQVWATALTLAHGVLTRIERVSNTEVIVHNNPHDQR